jgi:glucose dehydrogenase
MYPPKGETNLGNFIAWDPTTGKIVWSDPEPFSVWSGALATAGDVVFYGTLEGYLKAVDAKTGQLLRKFKTPSGIISNINTYVPAVSSTSPYCPVLEMGRYRRRRASSSRRRYGLAHGR